MANAARSVVVAGATGAIGRPLCRLLVSDGWQVSGTTRRPDKARELEAMGVVPLVVDVFDAAALAAAVLRAAPAIVVHQLTDLPPGLDPALMAAARERNTRIREIGTQNLLAAARAAGARRIVAQSIAFAYALGPLPHAEEDPLDASARGVISLETQVLGAPLDGVVLRYGRLYGPGTGVDAAPKGGPLHVDAAADAARRALLAGDGIYNIAENDGTVAVDRAVSGLGWSPDFRQ